MPCYADNEINLNAMITIKNELNCSVGFSDHSKGNEASIVAVSMGADVIEKHYTINKNLDGPDHKASLNPKDFKIYVEKLKTAEDLMIAGNKTAQQSIKSALSSAHVREVLIYIEDGIAEILKAYRFEFNTVQTRLEIKTLADNFMASVQADNGVYDFRNIMDSSNNTTEVIDANMGILDTYVEPVKGLEILVHRTTVLKTGAIATGQYV